ncbi:MAG: efflux RND transporter periplasmic adaptor subunit [Gemmatimonadales bacterium]|jgi:HlyD family secretion protein|nr:efflux RND transporter periplasmic adaptor subunit [Gemmatimonadales bacterium]
MRIRFVAGLSLAALACSKPAPPPVYQALPVERRDIVVSAQASGSVQPDTTVEVKTRASGEVLEILAETGQLVQRGQMIIRIDARQARNAVNNARANLDVARAQLEIAKAQFDRSQELLKAQTITQQEFETAQLSYANARAAVVRAQIEIENNQISLEDTDVRAPITGVIIQRGVERGQVVASATFNAGGGTVLMKMADLNLVQVRTLVDETDIGKVKPGLATSVTVDAYPNRPFRGEVLKIEPLAEVQQNVTMFPVLVRIDNRDGLLRPGMNAEVEIHVGRRDSVLTVPNSALRTQKDVESAATVLGLTMDQVREQLAAGQPADTANRQATLAATPGEAEAKPAGNTMTTPDGRTVKLPEGVTEQQMRAIFAKFRSGEQPTPAERQILQQMRRLNGGQGGGPGGARRGGQGGGDYQFGGDYIVFKATPEGPRAINVRTGLTDLDHAEVVSGLALGDSVLILPSASLVQSQQEFKERVTRMTGGGGVPGMQQSGQQRSGQTQGGR